MIAAKSCYLKPFIFTIPHPLHSKIFLLILIAIKKNKHRKYSMLKAQRVSLSSRHKADTYFRTFLFILDLFQAGLDWFQVILSLIYKRHPYSGLRCKATSSAGPIAFV
ncbi:hypothetical protein HanPI659440_Chr17g0664261 [Helianthus annuus]|nr:hypothetical protein HanPI659440_Chr17g0664261 [Helianthus annuus]